MNWFDASGLTNLAKTALKEAQKTLDKALDLEEGITEDSEKDEDKEAKTTSGTSNDQKEGDFLSSWGLTVSAESSKENIPVEQPVVTESPLKGSSGTLWGSFAGSFFENTKDDTIVQAPKAKSIDDLLSKTQTISEGEVKKGNDSTKDERRCSSRSAGLSLISSVTSSDSVEILSHSLKTTPDSEASIHSVSHSSSAGLKQHSESVEILGDSLISPSIECIGFDSTSELTSSTSSITPSAESSERKSGDKTEKPEADSISLVPDDDEDTISYNSVSECTAPTVLDSEDKILTPFTKAPIRTDPHKKLEKDLLILEQPIPTKMQFSENSSNDGSWSDRTLNADNDSLIDSNTEDTKKDDMDVLIEKLSDSSSIINVKMKPEMIRTDSSAFVKVEKRQSEDSNDSSKDLKERISPISSDSKSDLVKIGSDRTSGHTSGDELETATSSDIEIIPSPNGENSFCRNSPAKYPLLKTKFDTTSPHIVDLVLGKTLATKIRGHNRESSEVSVQSNTSDESGENDRLMRRLSDMAEVLEARETKLIEISRNNAELAESNAELKSQVESLISKFGGGDINVITEDYTQRMSALEKKFQQAIRDKDDLRKQLDSYKSENSRKNSSELENALKEKDEIISQLHEEGEKLAKQQLHHSNIIKKLRAKDKDNEQVIKSLRDKISELTSELDRLKRSISAKEELEVSQIEAVYRLTVANNKYETELYEAKSLLDDTTQRLESARTSLEATRKELNDAQRAANELRARKETLTNAQEECESLKGENERLRAQLQQLRAEMVAECARWQQREDSLRSELSSVRSTSAPDCMEGGALVAQLARLQDTLLQRDGEHQQQVRMLTDNIESLRSRLSACDERERVLRDEVQSLRHNLSTHTHTHTALQDRLTDMAEMVDTHQRRADDATKELNSKSAELEQLKGSLNSTIRSLQERVTELEASLVEERMSLDTEKKRNALLQEQLSTRGDISPSHSLASDSLSLTQSLWGAPEPAPWIPSVACSEELVSTLQRREGEVRSLTAALTHLTAERARLTDQLAHTHYQLEQLQHLQEQYDALLQMYGEKEEQLMEVKLDLQDVTQLYKAQLDELIALRKGQQ